MASLSTLVSWARPSARWCIDVANHYGVPVTVTSVRRSRARQAALYRSFLAGESRFPAAPPGRSAHEYGMAWDSWVPDAYRSWWIDIRRLAGWHVPAGDWIHAGVPNWRAYV